MRMSESSKDVRTYRCGTCGDLYSSTVYDYERGDGMMLIALDTPHACKFPASSFVVRDIIENKYVNGKLLTRKVQYRDYNCHFYESDIIEKTEWIGESHP